MKERDSMSNNALRDGNKVPSLLVSNADLTDTVPVRASEGGAMMVSIEGGQEKPKLKEVIKLDLGQSRDKVLFDSSFGEITVPVIDGEFTLYLDEPVENKGLTINRALSMETPASRFYISNSSGSGRAEIWLWE